MSQRLFAKSWNSNNPPPDSVFLPGHLADVLSANQQLVSSTGDDQLKAVGLSPAKWRERFERISSLAAVIHDLGKANDHFQGLVNPTDWPDRKGRRQGLRHEWVTLLILEQPELKDWILPAVGSETDLLIAMWAVTGHHPAFNRASPPTRPVGKGEGSEIEMLLAHPDFRKSLEWMGVGEEFGLGKPPKCNNITLHLAQSTFTRLTRWSCDSQDEWEEMNEDEQKFVAVLKANLVAADVAGSALPRVFGDQQERIAWIADAFGHVPTSEELGQLVAERLECSPEHIDGRLREFQKQVSERAGMVTFVKAGCGTGKTLAAYHWAHKQWPGRRLYFCYPTTGTATEGFRDYLLDADAGTGRFGADLFHSRREVDFEVVLDVQGDSEDDNDGSAEENDAFIRIASFAAWSTPIVSCTVDTVLGLVQNNRRGLLAWPALSGAAFVFDEIHAYDEDLFGALLRFLRAARGNPILLMTASLPARYQNALESCMERRGETLSVIRGPEELEARHRYHRHRPTVQDWPLREVDFELAANGKVLWVCNTVGRAMDAAANAREHGLEPIIYHSRFRYVDRVQRHRALIESFKSEGGALAICTQVAEMSLDLSATLLVTDLAPVPSLIQRLGRLNRRAEADEPTRPFIVVEPLDEDGSLFPWPYKPEQLEDASVWLEALPGMHISQADLARCWIDEDPEGQPLEIRASSAWLDGGPETHVLPLREGSPGLTVVLHSDLDDLRNSRLRLAEVAVPMPSPSKNFDWKNWKRFRGVPVAPEFSIDYDSERGAQWQKAN